MLIEPTRQKVSAEFVYAFLIQSQNDTVALILYSRNTNSIFANYLSFQRVTLEKLGKTNWHRICPYRIINDFVS